jgi:leader peptidase (prepilin peptidase)/N-methyltransferase
VLASALLGLLGLVLGSFIATLVLRWPEGRTVHGRSACDGCGRTLAARELVPLLSAALQRGRCRHCGAAIDPLHWRIEFAAAAIGASAGAVAGPEGVAGAVLGWLLLTLAALDLRAWWLPDRLTATLAAAGLGTGLAGLAPPLPDRLIGGVAGFALLWLVARAYRRVRGRQGMGGGDPKLFGAIGLWLGWAMLPAVLLVASLIGLGLALFRHVTGRTVARTDALPLGAMLAAAAYPAWIIMVAFRP